MSALKKAALVLMGRICLLCRNTGAYAEALAGGQIIFLRRLRNQPVSDFGAAASHEAWVMCQNLPVNMIISTRKYKGQNGTTGSVSKPDGFDAPPCTTSMMFRA